MPFVKGDTRINRKGRPKSFDQVRALAQQIAKEGVTQDGKPVEFNGRQLTVIEAILRQWAQSKKPPLQQLFVEYAYGKVPTPVNVSGDSRVRIVFDDDVAAVVDAGVPGTDT